MKYKHLILFLIGLFSMALVACGKEEPEPDPAILLPTQPPIEIAAVTPTPTPVVEETTPTPTPLLTELTKEQCLEVIKKAAKQQAQAWNISQTLDAQMNLSFAFDFLEEKISLNADGVVQAGEESMALLMNVSGTSPEETIDENLGFYVEVNPEEKTYTEYTTSGNESEWENEPQWEGTINRLQDGETLYSLTNTQDLADILFILEDFDSESIDLSFLDVSFKDENTLRIELPASAFENIINALLTRKIELSENLSFGDDSLEDVENINTPDTTDNLDYFSPVFSITEGTSSLYSEIGFDHKDQDNFKIKEMSIVIKFPFVVQGEEGSLSFKASINIDSIGTSVIVEKPLGIEDAIVTDMRNYSLGYEFSEEFEDVYFHDEATPIYRNKEIKKEPSNNPTKLEFLLQGKPHAIRQSFRYFVPEGYSIVRIQDKDRDYVLKTNEPLPSPMTPYSVYLQGEGLPALVLQIQTTEKSMTMLQSEVIGVAYAGEDFVLPKGITCQSSYRDAFFALERPSETKKEENTLYAYWYYGDYTLSLKFVEDKLISFSISKNE